MISQRSTSRQHQVPRIASNVSSARASESPLHELLVCLLATFDDGSETLSKADWKEKAAALTYVADEAEWRAIRERLATRTEDVHANQDELNLSLTASYFSNKHGEVIQELFRKINVSLVGLTKRAETAEERLSTVEADLDRTVLRAEKERQQRAHAIIRRSPVVAAKVRWPRRMAR